MGLRFTTRIAIFIIENKIYYNEITKHNHKFICELKHVRTQFVTTPKWYWVRTLKAQTIKFVERGLKG